MIRRIPAALALLAVCLLVDLIAPVWMTIALIAGSRRGWRLAFGAHVEAVRQWGRDRRAEIGL